MAPNPNPPHHFRMARLTTGGASGQPAQWLPLAGWLMLAAAVLHLWEVQDHGRVWWGYGVFFTLIVLAQGLSALLLPRYAGSRAYLMSGVLGNLALTALWAWSRSVGLPVGPYRHAVAIGPVDAVTMTLQTLVVVLLVQALLRGRAASRSTGRAYASTP